MDPIYILLSLNGGSIDYITVTNDVVRARAWYKRDKHNHQVRCFEVWPEWGTDGEQPRYGDGERRPAFGDKMAQAESDRAELARLEERLAMVRGRMAAARA